MSTLALHGLHASLGARFREFSGWNIPDSYGDVEAEYDTVLRSAGAIDLSWLGKFRVSGRDRVRYLHSMLSNDIKSLTDGNGLYAALLTHQGRMESDVFVYAAQGEFWLECMPAGSMRLRETLEKYIVADDVSLEEMTGAYAILSLQGPSARAAVETTAGLQLADAAHLNHRALTGPGGTWRIVRHDRCVCAGYDLWLPVADAPAVWKRWSENSIRPVGMQALDRLRTEAGIPWFGVDMDDRRLPMEMGLDSAISLTKGCYRGQEIVARVTYRGKLDRGLAAVALDADQPPPQGSEIRAGGEKAGEVTSAVFSPRLGSPLALGILKSEFRQPGTPVEVHFGGESRPGRVVALPAERPRTG
jgi:folate-binding protein YgfZ